MGHACLCGARRLVKSCGETACEERCGALRCFREINNGAEGGTRTPMVCPTRPSNVRVYQFHHFGMKTQVEVKAEVENWFSLTLPSTLTCCCYFFITGCFSQT